MDTMRGADAIAVAGTAGAHALAWYLGLLALLLACERFAWSVRGRRHGTGEVAKGGRRRSSTPLVLGVGLVIVAAAGFGGIAYVTRHGAFALADQVFLDAIQTSVSTQAIKEFKWITWFGDARTLAVLCIGTAAVLLARGDNALALGMLASAGGNGLLNAALKRMFDRSCPRLGVDPLLGHGLCFPSGHTSGAVVTYGMLAYALMRILPRRWHLPVLMSATTLIFTVGCSRVFVQAHFPSDVLAGFASGSAWLALVVVCTESWLRGWRPGWAP
jgi:membrane-associated phospholipid phosphatase